MLPIKSQLRVFGLGPEAQIRIVKETVTAPKIGDRGYGCHFDNYYGYECHFPNVNGF
jgi:hypothetical protein